MLVWITGHPPRRTVAASRRGCKSYRGASQAVVSGCKSHWHAPTTGRPWYCVRVVCACGVCVWCVRVVGDAAAAAAAGCCTTPVGPTARACCCATNHLALRGILSRPVHDPLPALCCATALAGCIALRGLPGVLDTMFCELAAIHRICSHWDCVCAVCQTCVAPRGVPH